MAFASDIVRRGAIEGIWMANHGGGAPRPDGLRLDRVVRVLLAPLLRSLPELLVERADEDRIGAMIASTVREILALVDAARRARS